MNILLDTHAFLWAILGDPSLSQQARAAYKAADTVYISSISTWEIAVKYGQGKLPLPKNPGEYIPEKRRQHAIRELPFEEKDALQVHTLPVLHKDPFDRMLICQAIRQGLTILTNDKLIRQYPVNTLW